MNVQVKRIDPSLSLPEYKSAGAVAFDIYVREDIEVAPHTTAFAPTNLIVNVPSGIALLLYGRSSLPKKGLMLANNVGVIDQDFHGPDDEIKLFLYNFTDEKVSIKKGDRLAQGVFTKIDRADWTEVQDDFKEESRGGFGSTG